MRRVWIGNRVSWVNYWTEIQNMGWTETGGAQRVAGWKAEKEETPQKQE
jgi:hypothetical protein